MKNIVLFGFMGTGKSIIGRRLAVEMGYRFADTDQIIEERVHKRIDEIFAEEGEPRFRYYESETVRDVSGWSGYVISTGGGVPLQEENVKALSEKGILVSLKARPEVILKRVRKRAGKRPLLKEAQTLSRINSLLAERKPYYDRAAISIDTSDIDVQESVRRIKIKVLEWMKENS
ncbi:MAG: shikimate kinase [Nitrospiria bacterium]